MSPEKNYAVVAGGKYFYFTDGHWAWLESPFHAGVLCIFEEAMRRYEYALGDGHITDSPRIVQLGCTVTYLSRHVLDLNLVEMGRKSLDKLSTHEQRAIDTYYSSLERKGK